MPHIAPTTHTLQDHVLRRQDTTTHRHSTPLSMQHLCSFPTIQPPTPLTCIRHRLQSPGVRPRHSHRFHHNFQWRLVDTQAQAMQWQRCGNRPTSLQSLLVLLIQSCSKLRVVWHAAALFGRGTETMSVVDQSWIYRRS